MIAQINPFEKPIAPESQPISSPVYEMPALETKRRGGLPADVISKVQGIYIPENSKPASAKGGLSESMGLKPGWGGGSK